MKSRSIPTIIFLIGFILLSISGFSQSNPELDKLIDSIVKVDYEKPYQDWVKKQKAIGTKNPCPNCPFSVLTEHFKKLQTGDINGAMKFVLYDPKSKDAGFMGTKDVEKSKVSKESYSVISQELKKGMMNLTLMEKPVWFYCSDTVARFSKWLLNVDGSHSISLEKIKGVWKIKSGVICNPTYDYYSYQKLGSLSDADRMKKFKGEAKYKANELLKQRQLNSQGKIEAKFVSISNMEGVGRLSFKKNDGTEIVFEHNYANDAKLPFEFTDENTSETNKSLVGVSFIIEVEKMEQINDMSGEKEVVNKIKSITQK